jgi:carboxypeptidase C (cathepsin A)
MIHRLFSITLIFFAVFLLIGKADAYTPKSAEPEEQQCTSPDELDEMLPADSVSTTEHRLHFKDLELSYQATAGTLPVKLDKDGPECRLFFISYHSQKKDKTSSPLTFVFNGGPGASSAYLHLGALGPKLVKFNEDGSMPGPPARMVDNLQTWLRFTDLVFVDPVGTGYSRCAKLKEDKTGKKAEAQAWDVKEDLTALAKFIRLYLSRYNRWLSPKYLVGESYGGFRVAALSDLLQSDFGIALNGLILVSPALQFELLQGNDYSLLPWMVTLPSYAATARFHGKTSVGLGNDTEFRKSLADVENFAVQEYLPALASSDITALDSRLGNFIGLQEQQIAQLNSRISPRRFAKELLRKSKLLVSVYDGSFSSIDPEPAYPFAPGKDPLLIQINTLLAAAFNSYIREQLKFETDIPYEILNSEVSHRWNWRSGLDSAQGFAGVAENLKDSMSTNKELRVLIAHGVFDLVTPYFGSVIVTRQMSLDPAITSNLSLKIYKGGHMFYSNDTARKTFFEDAVQFYTSATTSLSR